MNRSNAGANNSTQSNQVAHLAERANQKSFNWAPLVRFLTIETDICDAEANPLELYFEVAELIVDDEDRDRIGINSTQLWYFRKVIESIKALHSGDESGIMFIAKDSGTTIIKNL